MYIRERPIFHITREREREKARTEKLGDAALTRRVTATLACICIRCGICIASFVSRDIIVQPAKYIYDTEHARIHKREREYER